MWGVGTTELIVFGFIAVLLFGNRLPNLARSVGSSLVEFKKGLAGIDTEVKEINKEINKEIKK